MNRNLTTCRTLTHTNQEQHKKRKEWNLGEERTRTSHMVKVEQTGR